MSSSAQMSRTTRWRPEYAQFKIENHVTILMEKQPFLPHRAAKQLMLRNSPVFQNEEGHQEADDGSKPAYGVFTLLHSNSVSRGSRWGSGPGSS